MRSGAAAPLLVAAGLAALSSSPASAQLFAPDWLVTDITQMPTFTKNGDGTYTFTNGLVTRIFTFSPGFGTIDFRSENRQASMLRAICPEGFMVLDNTTYPLGAISGTNAAIHGYINRSDPNLITPDPGGWDAVSWELSSPVAPFPWTPGTRGSPNTSAWPPVGLTLAVKLKAPATAPPSHQAVTATLLYELYPGIPLLTKWLVVNSSAPAAQGVVVTSTIPEYLCLAPPYSPLSFSPYPPSTVQTDVTSYLYAQTDQAHGTGVWWVDDPNVGNDPGQEEPVLYTNYTIGPGVILSGGQEEFEVEVEVHHHSHSELGTATASTNRTTVRRMWKPRYHRTLYGGHPVHDKYLGGGVAEFVSFRTFLLVTDTSDTERYGLSVRRLYRLWAPHAQENPVFFHAVGTTQPAFEQEIQQMAATGFEMLIYSFGSGFNLETLNQTYIDMIKGQIALAKSYGIEVGGYDLICLQRGDGGYGGNVGFQWDTVMPPGYPVPYGEDACFASGWVDQLSDFVDTFVDGAGLSMVETDGPYGGSVCASVNHSYHLQLSDSVYQQTKMQASWYSGLRGKNVYINQPDNYFFQGGQRTGIGYDEDQFSLPRWLDVTTTRMSIYEDTYRKMPTQGWTFLPLIDYHGGGDAAAFEPMSEHLPEYEMALAQNLGAGVAACYRGYRLYDTPEVAAVVTKWVSIYKRYRPIIISDIIHVRRPDGQSLDSFMHANAFLPVEKGFALVFNPTLTNITQTLSFPLYYTGITTAANFAREGGTPVTYTLARDYSVQVSVTLAAQSVTWFVITDAGR